MFEQDLSGYIQDRKINKKRTIYLLITVLIGLLLISPKDITWARDRINYIIYAKSSWTIMQRYLSRGILPFLSNEPLFLGLNMLLSSIFSAETVIKFIIFSSTVGVLYSLGKISNYNFLILFFFLFMPQIIKNHIIHLRQGLALSFYLIGLTSDKKYGRFIKMCSPFIHTSFVFIIFFEYLEKYFKKINFDFLLKILYFTIFSIMLMFTIDNLAMFFGDRRFLEYSFSMADEASGLGFIIWILAGGLFIVISNKNCYYNIICCYGIIFYLISYFLIDFGARIFENIIPLLLAVILTDNRKEFRVSFIMFFLFYGMLQWYLKGIHFLI